MKWGVQSEQTVRYLGEKDSTVPVVAAASISHDKRVAVAYWINMGGTVVRVLDVR